MTDLFQNTGDQTDNIDPNKDYLAELVGEGKKFKDPKDLAKGKYEADQFIARLQNELAGLREELGKRNTIEDFMTQMRTSGNTQDQSNLNNQQDETGDTGNTNQIDIEALLERKLQEREQARTHSQNQARVRSDLEKALGSNFVNRLSEVTQSLGMSKEQANHLAATAPDAFLTMVYAKVGHQQTKAEDGLFSPPASQIRSSDFKPQNTDRTKAYYDNIKATNPSEYWSPKVQNQMHNDAIRLGDKFFT